MDNERFVGMPLVDFLDISRYKTFGEYHNAFEQRKDEQNEFILRFSDYYIYYRPNTRPEYDTVDNNSVIRGLISSMNINQGIDIIYTSEYIKIVGYFNDENETIWLYPISNYRLRQIAEKTEYMEIDEAVAYVKSMLNCAEVQE